MSDILTEGQFAIMRFIMDYMASHPEAAFVPRKDLEDAGHKHSAMGKLEFRKCISYAYSQDAKQSVVGYRLSWAAKPLYEATLAAKGQ